MPGAIFTNFDTLTVKSNGNNLKIAVEKVEKFQKSQKCQKKAHFSNNSGTPKAIFVNFDVFIPEANWNNFSK